MDMDAKGHHRKQVFNLRSVWLNILLFNEKSKKSKKTRKLSNGALGSLIKALK